MQVRHHFLSRPSGTARLASTYTNFLSNKMGGHLQNSFWKGSVELSCLLSNTQALFVTVLISIGQNYARESPNNQTHSLMIGQCLNLCPFLFSLHRHSNICIMVEGILEETCNKICSENCAFITSNYVVFRNELPRQKTHCPSLLFAMFILAMSRTPL